MTLNYAVLDASAKLRRKSHALGELNILPLSNNTTDIIVAELAGLASTAAVLNVFTTTLDY
jgi:hypothetical protein